MRGITRRVVLVFSICAIASGFALAEIKSERVTFYKDVTVNGTLLEKGEYKVSFDDQAKELVIKKHGETVAKAPARAEKRDEKPKRTRVYTTQNGNESIVTAIAFAGEGFTVVVTNEGRARARRD